MATHITKFEHKDGVKLIEPEAWCGKSSDCFSVAFINAQHFLLSEERGDIWGRPVCKNCINAIKRVLGGNNA